MPAGEGNCLFLSFAYVLWYAYSTRPFFTDKYLRRNLAACWLIIHTRGLVPANLRSHVNACLDENGIVAHVDNIKKDGSHLSLGQLDLVLLAYMANTDITIETAQGPQAATRATATTLLGLPLRAGELSNQPPLRLRYLENALHYDAITGGDSG